ncbi:MAG: hypothetical protein GC184_06935 [Rhizobiales bacterium]|nr:hypothetical protein [Hyphomicrobiales bacterium]
MSTKKTTPVAGNSTVTTRALKAAYSHYGNTAYVSSGDGKTSSQAVRRVFAAALLSSASFMAVGAATSTSALAGVCNQAGQTVNCGGSFTDTIDYDVVNDLTVVLNVGASVDTSNNYSEASGDNLGIVVYSDGDATIINRGGVYTGVNGAESYSDRYGNHGIFATANQDGTATVKNYGNIFTETERSYAAYAYAEEGDAVAYNAGLISTSEDYASGLIAHVESGDTYASATATNAGAGRIYTDGNYLVAVGANTSAEGGYATASNAGLVKNYGDHTTAVSADAYYADASNTGTIAMGNDEGDYAYDSTGVAAYGVYATATNAEDATITIYGGDSAGVVASAEYSATASNAGSITITGEDSFGVVASGSEYAKADNTSTGSITINGDSGVGVIAYGDTAIANNDGSVDINGGVGGSSFSLSGWFSRSAPNLNGGDNEGSDAAYNYMALGVAAFGDVSATATNGVDGTINIDGPGAVGLSATAYGAANATNHGSITVGSLEDGGFSFGVMAVTEDGTATAKNYGSIATFGNYSSGLLAASEDGNVVATNYVGGSITTKNYDGYSNAAVGVAAFTGTGDATATNGAALSSEDVVPNDVTTADITTYGDLAFGVAANSVYGHAYATNTEDGVIVTHGDLAVGVLASSMSDRESRAQNDGSITTYGAGAAGVAALGGGMGQTESTPYGVVSAILDPNNILGLADVEKPFNEDMVAINTGTIHTNGLSSIGVYAAASVSDAYAGNSGNIYTTEDRSLGVAAASITGEARAINYSGGYIHTDGEQATGVFAISGNSASGYVYDVEGVEGDGAYAVNGGNFFIRSSEDLARAVIVTTGDNAVGVNAIAYDSSAWALNKYADITTGVADVSGFKAHGLYAISTGGTAWASNKYYGDITTSGDEASGIKAIASGYTSGALAANKYYSDVETFGDSAYGVAAFSEGDDAISSNKYHSTVTTHGDRSIGVLAYASEDAIAVNSGYSSVTTGGYNAAGVVAYSLGGEATALNGPGYFGEEGASSITTYGDNSDGLVAISEDGNALAANVYGSTIVTHGEDSFGVTAVAINGTATVYNGSNVETEEGLASDGSSITTYGIDSKGIYAVSLGFSGLSEDHDVSVKNYGSITTHGRYADGIHASSEDGSVTVLNDSYATINTGSEVIVDAPRVLNDGYRAFGIAAYTVNEDILVINRGSITTNGEDGVGIYAEADGYGNITIYNSGTITTNGDGTDAENTSSGIFADAHEGGNVLIVNEDGGSITTNGDYAYGIIAYGDGDAVTVKSYGSITTDGYESGGIYARNDYGAVTIVNGSTIVTNGEDSTGIWGVAESNGDLSITNQLGASVKTYGDDSIGIYAEGQSTGNITVTNAGTVATTGADAHAIYAYHDGEGNTYVTNTEDGVITTTGDGAHGIFAESEEDGYVYVTNDGSITVTGEDAIGIKAYSYYSAYVVNTGTISSAGTAVDVYAGYGDDSETTASFINEGGTVTGDVQVTGYYGAEFYNDSGTITGAVFLDSFNENVNAGVTGTGNDITKGIHADAEGSADLYFAQSDSMTFADGVEGYALSGWDLIEFRSGTTIFDNGGTEDTVNIHGTNIDIGGFPAEVGTYAATVQFSGGNDSSTYVYSDQTDVKYNGTLSVDAATTVNFSGTVLFEGGSFSEDGNATFRTQLDENGAGVITGDRVIFENNSNIYVDVTGAFAGAIIDDDILIASASGNEGYGVEDFGAVVADNTILFNFQKVIGEDGTHTVFYNEGDNILYSGNELFLRVVVDETAFDLTSEDGGTINEKSMAAALDKYIQTHPTNDPLVLYLAQFGTPEEQQKALLQLIKDMLPDESDGGVGGTIGMSDLVFDMILDRLAAGGDFAALENGKTGVAAGDMALGGDGDWAIWGRMGALQAEFTPSSVPGYDAKTWGISVGIDGSVAKDVRIGLAYMYQQAKIDENGTGANSNTDITGNGVIGYMAYTPDPYFLNLAVGYSWNSYEGKRFTGLGTNTADYNGTQALARAELGRVFTDGKLDITPSIGLRYNFVSQDAYTETGLLALHIDSQDVTSVRGTIGVGAKYNMDLAGGGKLIPEASVKLLNQFADPAGSITGNVVGGGAFTTNTTGRDDLSYGVGAGLTYQANDSLTMSLQYRGEFQSDYSQNAGEFNIRLAF